MTAITVTTASAGPTIAAMVTKTPGTPTSAPGPPAAWSAPDVAGDIEVLAYYFPSWHTDPLNERWHGAGWTEWELLGAARPRFEGHRQPIMPAWGRFDEANPEWASKEIDLAADHGVTTFLYDWYWYEGGPFLHRALEDGFLRAPNRGRMKFALMWANHDWTNVHPARLKNRLDVLASGMVDAADLDRVVDHLLEHYLLEPNYLKIDGEAYFSIYDVAAFVDGLGGLAQAGRAIARFRERVQAAGLPGLHVNLILTSYSVLPTDSQSTDPNDVIDRLGASSVGTYTWIHHFRPLTFPTCEYADAARRMYDVWADSRSTNRVPYQPNVSMGWDSSPRTVQTDRFEQSGGYPFLSVLANNTPAAFREALERAREFVEAGPTPADRVVTINAWNEWTEGSYLLPDTLEGTRYLEAIREVFG